MMIRTPLRASDLDEGGYVDDAQVGIGRRLGEEELGVRSDRLAERVEVRRLDHRRLDAHAREKLLDELTRAAVAVAGDDQVRSFVEQRHERRRRGAHPRREEHRLLATFEGADLALDGAPGRVAVATVLLAVALAFLVVGDLLRVAEPEGGGLVDRRRDRVGFLLAELAGVDGAGRAPAVCRLVGQVGLVGHAFSRSIARDSLRVRPAPPGRWETSPVRRIGRRVCGVDSARRVRRIRPPRSEDGRRGCGRTGTSIGHDQEVALSNSARSGTAGSFGNDGRPRVVRGSASA